MWYLIALGSEVTQTQRKFIDGFNLGTTFNSHKKTTLTEESKEIINKKEEMKPG